MRNVRVTTRVEITEHGATLADLSYTSEEKGVDNPSFVTRATHRRAHETADTLRVMLAPLFGEPDPEWRTS